MADLAKRVLSSSLSIFHIVCLYHFAERWGYHDEYTLVYWQVDMSIINSPESIFTVKVKYTKC